MGASQAPACGCCKEELSDERRVDGERGDRPVDPTADVVAVETVFSVKESAAYEVAVEPTFSVKEHVFSTKDKRALGSFPLPAARLPKDPSVGGAEGGRPVDLAEAEVRRAARERLRKVPSEKVPMKMPSDLPLAQNFGKLTAVQVIARAAAHVKTGDGAFAKGDWGSAVAAYTEALALNASLSSAWAGRGGANLRRGALEDALADLNEALRLEEDSLVALLDRAEARSRTGDLDGAIEDFDRKLSMAPADGRALFGRGEARLKQGDRNGAIADLQVAMRLSYPGSKEMYSAAKNGSRVSWAR